LLGFFAKDDMRLGGLGDNNDTEHDVILVKKQAFGVATGE